METRGHPKTKSQPAKLNVQTQTISTADEKTDALPLKLLIDLTGKLPVHCRNRNCGEEIEKDHNGVYDKFCSNCGKPVDLKCPRCGAMRVKDADERFCWSCGYHYTTTETEASAISLQKGTDSAYSSDHARSSGHAHYHQKPEQTAIDDSPTKLPGGLIAQPREKMAMKIIHHLPMEGKLQKPTSAFKEETLALSHLSSERTEQPTEAMEELKDDTTDFRLQEEEATDFGDQITLPIGPLPRDLTSLSEITTISGREPADTMEVLTDEAIDFRWSDGLTRDSRDQMSSPPGLPRIEIALEGLQIGSPQRPADDADEETMHASAQNLPTSPADGERAVVVRSDEVTNILQSLFIEIGRTLDQVKAGHHIITVDPENYRKLSILGVGVEAADNAFETEKQFDGFTINTHNVKCTASGHPIYLDHLNSLPMALEKRNDREGPEHRLDEKVSICELIVKGRKKATTGEQNYGVTVAHVYLGDERCKTMISGTCNQPAIENDVLRDASNSDWYLRLQEENWILKVGLPIFAYQQYFAKEEGKRFMWDIAFVEIGDKLPEQLGLLDADNIRQRKKPLCHHCQGGNNLPYTISGFFDVDDIDDIKKLEGKKVLVGKTIGCISSLIEHVPRGILPPTRPTDSFEFGLHIMFYTSDRLKRGDSGSVVYVVDEDGTNVYILGMLVARLVEKDNVCTEVNGILQYPVDSPRTMYIATVIKNSFQEMSHMEYVSPILDHVERDPDKLQWFHRNA